MMMNIFSIFDPTSYFKLSLNWIVLMIIYFYIPNKYYFVESVLVKMFKMLILMSGKLFKEVSMPNYLVLNFLCVTTFIYLVLMNFISLFPFTFTSTAHPVITLGLGVTLWLSFFMMGFINNFKKSCSHLVPEGSPLILSPFMVIIESVSHLIRPFTLSIRLVANMMAGHLIIGLLSSISLISLYGFMSSLILQNILFMLEIGVTIIQGFVFSILLLLYALEYY